MMTLNGAVQNGEDSYKGSIEPGKVADLAVLNVNLTDLPVEEIKHIQVEKTILDGKNYI